jgi:hypothetical protein
MVLTAKLNAITPVDPRIKEAHDSTKLDHCDNCEQQDREKVLAKIRKLGDDEYARLLKLYNLEK